MSVTRPFLIVSAIAAVAAGLAACAPDTLPPAQGSAAVASPTTGGPITGQPSPDLVTNSASSDSTTAETIQYQCNDGAKITASYPQPTTAVVDYDGQARHMTVAVSTEGTRYVGTRYEWWTTGSGPGAIATLYAHQADHSTGKIISQCSELD